MENMTLAFRVAESFRRSGGLGVAEAHVEVLKDFCEEVGVAYEDVRTAQTIIAAGGKFEFEQELKKRLPKLNA